MKKIPVGIEDFKEIINNNCYYIDKTKFIANILDDGSKSKTFHINWKKITRAVYSLLFFDFLAKKEEPPSLAALPRFV